MSVTPRSAVSIDPRAVFSCDMGLILWLLRLKFVGIAGSDRYAAS
jgi:hypothetical protein